MFKCVICGKKCKTERGYKIHIKRCHKLTFEEYLHKYISTWTARILKIKEK